MDIVIIFTSIFFKIVKRKYILPILLIIQIVLVKTMTFFPSFVEEYYSLGWYRYISKRERILLGQLPFSLGDILYGLLIIYLIYLLWISKKTWREHWKNNLLNIASGLSVFYFLFHLLWGLNYYRLPLTGKMNIQTEYNDADLIAFTEKLIVKTNEIHLQITHNPKQKVSSHYTQEQLFDKSLNGYQLLAKKHPYFTYEEASIKKSLFSLPLSYMGFAGYLNPFTNESQVNDKLPLYTFPNVICHEMAHQMGYASESECNFIGFLACINNEDLHFQYSAYTVALRYCLENIYLKNETEFERLKEKIHQGVLENFKESEKFWEQYDTIIDKGFHAFYDQFLKSNEQQDGLESYSKFVDLLINFYREKDF